MWKSFFFLPVNGAWKELLPPVFGCYCPCSLSLTLSSQTKSLSIHLQALTHQGQPRHHSATLLLQYGPQTESTFHCNINFLMSIRSNLTPQFMLEIFSIKIANWSRRTLCSFYPVKQPHLLCLRGVVVEIEAATLPGLLLSTLPFSNCAMHHFPFRLWFTKSLWNIHWFKIQINEMN